MDLPEGLTLSEIQYRERNTVGSLFDKCNFGKCVISHYFFFLIYYSVSAVLLSK